MSPTVSIHVDGACVPNPGRGAWGAVLRAGAHEKRLSGLVPEERSTNQRAEIHAAISALSALKAPSHVRLFSDSEYLVKTALGQYKRRKNHDLWERLDAVAAPHEVEWLWVRGHVGDPGNELAHILAEGALAA